MSSPLHLTTAKFGNIVSHTTTATPRARSTGSMLQAGTPRIRQGRLEARVTEAVLPLSGHIVQWRAADSRWRQLTSREDADDIAWQPWTGDRSVIVQADGDVWNRPSWLVASGELPESGRVEVLMTDDTRVAVVTVGKVWVCEWVGQGEPVTVQYGDDFPMTARMPRPDFL
jgi:hypothetical protein